MSTTLMARLSKTEDRVLCGRINCGADIAVVVQCYAIGGNEFSVLFFPFGWSQRDDGVWVLSRRTTTARKKATRGERPFPARALIRRGHELDESGRLLHAIEEAARTRDRDVPNLWISTNIGCGEARVDGPSVPVTWSRDRLAATMGGVDPGSLFRGLVTLTLPSTPRRVNIDSATN